ncbi:MAG TPA: class I SAM-dependent methyltransferase [Thermoanaerobaculia bacterium]|nr:class I SAM-dependent methyltransferase [Thermoanaerobaculia bacterium]
MKLCKVYGLDDARDADPLWQELLLAMSPDWKSHGGALHRKYWEWGLGLYGLHKLGFIRPDAVALGVGAGVEWPLFYLANQLRMVHATDLYSPQSYFQGLDPTIPGNAAKLAPFPYRTESLVFQKMDALDLQFEDDTFDFVFTFSSIEHFGGHAGAVLAMQEIARVLKPGGVACVATELILAGPDHHEFFKAADFEPCFGAGSGLEFVEPLDLSVDAELVSNPVVFEVAPGFQGYTGPHTSVRCGDLTFTSIEFFLRKPANWQPASRARIAALRARMHGGNVAYRTRLRAAGLAHRVRLHSSSLVRGAARMVPPRVRRNLKKLLRRSPASP